MITLPDYPDRGIAEQRARLERSSLILQLLLITAGALWLFISLGSDSSLLFRLGPVTILFSSSLIIPDLVEFGPNQRARVSTACCFLWPPLLAFAEKNRYDGASIGSVLVLISVSFLLFYFSALLLHTEVNSLRLRGLSTFAGFGIAIPIIAINSSLESWAIIFITGLLTTIPLLISKDGSEVARSEFYEKLRRAEKRILDVQTGNSVLQQSNSLLKTAREEGRKNPELGLQLVRKAEDEASRILAFLEDLTEMKEQSVAIVAQSEQITGHEGEARRMIELGMGEMESGSLRAAETIFKSAKDKAMTIISHWENANLAISQAEDAVGSEEGHLIQAIRNTIETARNAMENEDPKYALAIVSEVPSQMGQVKELMSRAIGAIGDAEDAISLSGPDTIDDANDRLLEAKEAIKSGNASLAIGLAEGITRSLRRESEAQLTVQRALRQKQSIIDRIPSGDFATQWLEKIGEIESLADSGSWMKASESLNSLTSDLDSLGSRISEARDMLDFISQDWIKLRKRLESSGIGPDNPDRSNTEKALSLAEGSLSDGRIEDCLESIGAADSAMESLRRLI